MLLHNIFQIIAVSLIIYMGINALWYIRKRVTSEVYGLVRTWYMLTVIIVLAKAIF